MQITLGYAQVYVQTVPPWLHCHGMPPRTGNGMPNGPIYTQSCGKETPCGKSLPTTPALGYRGCLIVFTVFRVAAKDPKMLSLRCMFSRFCTPSHTLPRKGLQQPNNGGVTHFPHVHQHQSSHTSDSSRSTPALKWIPTRHGEEQASRKPPGQKGSHGGNFWSQRLSHFQNAYNTQLASRLYWSFLSHLPAKAGQEQSASRSEALGTTLLRHRSRDG